MRLKEKETEQQLAEVAAEMIQDEMNKTKMMKNAGNETSGDQTMMRMVGFSVFGSSVERDHNDSDLIDMIKQVCARSDIISRFVFHYSGMKDTID